MTCRTDFNAEAQGRPGVTIGEDLMDKLATANARIDRLTHALLRRSGYFEWGDGAWIHEDDEGTVLDTADALARVLGGKR